MGDPVPGAKWSRTSKVNEMVKDLNHALNCFFCHDPHSAKPRVVRDGLIQALTRPEKDTLWHRDARAAQDRRQGHGRARATRARSPCSTATTPTCSAASATSSTTATPAPSSATGQPIGMTDARTNHFPFKNVNEIGKHYTDLKFRDFKHGITGALLWKAQHPDVENYYGSKHQKAGVECSQCHMPKVKDAKTGKTYTSHWQTSPKHYIKETCLQCHQGWSEKQANYVIDSLKNKQQGKMRKAEFWLTRMIDKFEEAKGAGVDEAVLNQVREKHYEAHIHWEWWAAGNGAALPQPGPGARIDQQVDDDLAGRHQAPRRRDGREACGARRPRRHPLPRAPPHAPAAAHPGARRSSRALTSDKGGAKCPALFVAAAR